MEKRSTNERYSSKRRVKVEDAPVKEETPTVQLVLQKNIKLNYTGKVTGNVYHFNGAGSVVSVDERDVPAMLEKGANRRSCCSGLKTSPYFMILGG